MGLKQHRGHYARQAPQLTEFHGHRTNRACYKLGIMSPGIVSRGWSQAETDLISQHNCNKLGQDEGISAAGCQRLSEREQQYSRCQIGQGLAVLLGVAQGDSKEDARYLANKVVNLRIFADESKSFCPLSAGNRGRDSGNKPIYPSGRLT
jgi:hypothetical protein